MRIVLGEGLVTSEGKKHAHNKKLMSPAFNQSSTQSNEKLQIILYLNGFFYNRTPILMLFQTGNDTKVLVLQRHIFVILIHSEMVPIFNTYTRQLITIYREKILKARGDDSDKNYWLQVPFLEDMSRLVSTKRSLVVRTSFVWISMPSYAILHVANWCKI